MLLSWHVDYWDYLGWKDPFATKAFTQRQRRYKRARGLKTMGTPHFFIGNRGYWGRNVGEGLRAKRPPAPVEIEATATATPKQVTASIKLKKLADKLSLPKSTAVVAVLFQKSATTKCTAGENAGKTLKEFFVVRAVHAPLAVQDALDKGVVATFAVPAGVKPTDLGVAVLVEDREKLETFQCRSVAVTAAGTGTARR